MLFDLGQLVRGQVLDEVKWAESRVRLAMPYRTVRGEVRVVYPRKPNVVGVVTASGEALTVRVPR